MFDDETDEIEAYCMTPGQDPDGEPQPIWTRRGARHAARSACGTTVFLMGKPWPTIAQTAAADPGARNAGGQGRRKLRSGVTYLNFCAPDSEFAEILAED